MIGGSGPSGNVFSEGNGTLSVYVTLSSVLSATDPIQVNLGFSGTAVLGTNCSTSAFIVIPANSLGGPPTTGAFITLTGLPNTVPDEPTATLFITIESIIDQTTGAVLNVARTLGGNSVLAELTDNNVNNNPFGSNPVISLPSTTGLTVNDNGGTTTITISQSVISQSADPVELVFSGTAVDGQNYIVTDANGKVVHSGDTVFIDAGKLSTTITVTGVDDFVIGPSHTLIISLVPSQLAADGTEASPTNDSVSVTIVQTDTKPAVGLSLSEPVFTFGGETVVTATLLQTTNAARHRQPVRYRDGDSQHRSLRHRGANQPSFGTATDQIIIPAGQSSGSIILTGLNDDLNRYETTVNIGIASVIGVSSKAIKTQTANYVNPNAPITFSIQNAVTAQGGVAAVQVFLERAGFPSQ